MKKLLAEFIGTMWLVLGGCGAAVLAAGIPDIGIGLVGVSLAFGLTVLTGAYALGHIFGGHFNPAVSIAMLISKKMTKIDAVIYIILQIIGAVLGVLIAHLMFELQIFQISLKLRQGPSQGFSEIVATFGLIIVIFGGLKVRPDAVPALVGFYITSAYWFTASTSFANPAVTLARSLSNTFAGINPSNIGMFIFCQFVGMLIAIIVVKYIFSSKQ